MSYIIILIFEHIYIHEMHIRHAARIRARVTRVEIPAGSTHFRRVSRFGQKSTPKLTPDFGRNLKMAHFFEFSKVKIPMHTDLRRN